MDKINEYRIIPNGTKIFSIKNQTELIVSIDELVQIKSICYDSDEIYVQLFHFPVNIPGLLPPIIGKGCDEWILNYSDTLPYTVSQYQEITYTYI